MAPPLKDNIDADVARVLAERFSAETDHFDADSFVKTLTAGLPPLELKDRINLVADQLAIELPHHYPDALALVVTVAESDVGGWASWTLCSFVERHGVEWPTESLEAMSTLTKFCTCEFAIRPFLEDHLELTRTYLRRWVKDPDETVRRLASEGTRPLLPWGPKVRALLEDPSIGIEPLNHLYLDESETVRRSVANHLNDVAKADPDLVVEVLSGWMSQSSDVDDRMIRHALRTLVKQGYPPALGLLGYTTEPELKVLSFVCNPDSIELGASIELSAELRSTAKDDQLLVIDFVIHHVKASGQTSPKVFKWTTSNLPAGETVMLTKKRTIQTASTRRYHAGVHRVELQVAGTVVASTEFNLSNSS
ncbi:MAG: DNA alkylation repair protein [Acidimicrobiales bacterium]